MSCSTPGPLSATKAWMRKTSGLTDDECAHLLHRLKANSPTHGPLTDDDRQTFLTRITTDLANDNLPTETVADLNTRMRSHPETVTDTAQVYALTNAVSEARRAATAKNDWIDSYAQRTGLTRRQTERLLNQRRRHHLAEGRKSRADTDWLHRVSTDPEFAHLPLSRATAAAICDLDLGRGTYIPSSAIETHHVNSAAIRSITYDNDTGRTEIRMHARPDEPYVHLLTREQADDLITARNVGAHYAQHVRRRPELAWEDPNLADTARRNRCGTCGQFTGDQGCTCPPLGTPDDLALVTQHARATLGLLSDTNEFAGERLNPERAHRWAAELPDGTQIDMRGMKPRSVARAARNYARTNPPDPRVQLPVRSTVVTAEGDRHIVVGPVTVTYLGHGDGYRLDAITEEAAAHKALRCDCPVYRERYDCPHLRATLIALSDGINSPTGNSADVPAALALTDAETVYRRELAARAAAAVDAAFANDPTGNGYQTNATQFAAEYEQARTRFIAGDANWCPYLAHDGALGGLITTDPNGPGRKFGIEIEFDIPEDHPEPDTARLQIGQALFAAGLTSDTVQQERHQTDAPYTTNLRGGWRYEVDESVQRGGEIISPVLADTEETWNAISNVCRVIRANGGTTSIDAGLHVNISSDDYGTDAASYNTLGWLVDEYSDVLYRLATNPADRYHRSNYRGQEAFARYRQFPTGGYSTASIFGTEDERGAHAMRTWRTTQFSLSRVDGSNHDRIEYRLWDATLEPAVIQRQVMLSAALTQQARAMAQQERHPGHPVPIGTHLSNRRSLDGSGTSIPNHESKQFRRFLDLILPTQETRSSIIPLFAVNDWQPANAVNRT